MPVLPFIALFAALGCVRAWQALQARHPAGPPRWTHALAALAVFVLLAAPAREAVTLGWSMGHRPDTRTAALAWLRRHVTPGARVAFDEHLRWYLPDLYRLPFAIRFAPSNAPAAWYLSRHIDYAVIQRRGPVPALPVVAAFFPPPYEHRGDTEHWTEDTAIIDPTLSIVVPAMPENAAVFPLTVTASAMYRAPIAQRAPGVYTETVRLPDQRFTPGSYTLTLSLVNGWPAPGTPSAGTVAVKIVVGRRTVGTTKASGTQPPHFTTPPFEIAQGGVFPVQVEFTFGTPPRPSEEMWALYPPADGCAIGPDTPALDVRQLTVEAWVYLEEMNEPPNMRRRGLESEGPILTKKSPEGYYLRLVGDAYNRIYADLTVAGRFSVGRVGLVPFRRWTHIAATYDGRQAAVYLNGAAAHIIRDPHYTGTINAQGAPLVIGCRDSGTPYQTMFKGLITAVRIWNRTLPIEAIRDDARLRPLPDDDPGLVGSWAFGPLAHGGVMDASGGGNNLTIKSVRRLEVDNRPAARPEWVSGRLLRAVTISRVAP